VFLDRRVDGLIVIACEGVLPQIQYLQSRDIPIVLVDHYFPEVASNYVALDNFQASYKGTNHLLDHGHNRIGMITLDTEFFHMRARTRGFITALSEFDPNPEESIVRLKEGFFRGGHGRRI
jgi:LacI family transcriptional regulator